MKMIYYCSFISEENEIKEYIEVQNEYQDDPFFDWSRTEFEKDGHIWYPKDFKELFNMRKI